ncbi:MAG: MFS transporter [Gammaproteobacteria bacterium]|nr:MFS transporter [Gammaproteobacteria bacterium]
MGFVNESGLINTPGTGLTFSLLWGFFGAEILIGNVCADIFCLMTGRKICPMGYIKLIPILTLPSFALQFISKPTNCGQCLMIGRFFSMVGQGLSGMAIPVFLTEVSGPSHRGPAIMLFRVCGVAMAAVASLLGHHKLLGTNDRWHWSFVVLLLMTLLGSAGLLVIPDSQEYFLSLGDEENAKKSLWGTLRLQRSSLEWKNLAISPAS